MGGKRRVSGVSPNYATLEALIRRLAPEAIAVDKWGTTQFELDGGLFGLAENDKTLSCYILIPGLLAEHKGLEHVPQSSCCLRFEHDDVLPLAAIEGAMVDAIKRKTKT